MIVGRNVPLYGSKVLMTDALAKTTLSFTFASTVEKQKIKMLAMATNNNFSQNLISVTSFD
jgi:hypothetical protein